MLCCALGHFIHTTNNHVKVPVIVIAWPMLLDLHGWKECKVKQLPVESESMV